MISYENGDIKYNYRAALILVNGENEILVQTKKKYNFWVLPGGRIELLETSEQTIEREMKEELNITVKPERAIAISEIINKKEKYHDNFVFYLAHVNNNIIKNKEMKCLDDDEIILQWINISKIKNINLYPNFLVDIIQNLPETVQFERIIID